MLFRLSRRCPKNNKLPPAQATQSCNGENSEGHVDNSKALKTCFFSFPKALKFNVWFPVNLFLVCFLIFDFMLIFVCWEIYVKLVHLNPTHFFGLKFDLYCYFEGPQ